MADYWGGGDYFDGVPEDDMAYDYEDFNEFRMPQSPSMAEMLEAINPASQWDTGMHSHISAKELMENCVLPTVQQMFFGLSSVIVFSFLLRVIAQLRRANSKRDIPMWIIHIASALFGVTILHHLFRWAFIYMTIPCLLCYILLYYLAPRGRHQSGPTVVGVLVAYVVLCELWLVDATTWHKIRGAQMLLSMKIISLAFDFGAGGIIDLPSFIEFMGYCFHIGTAVFGPWVSYEEYAKSLLIKRLPTNLAWALKCIASCCFSVVCLLYSTCATRWLFWNSAWKWLVAYRDAQSFRFSHYFVSFMSETTAVFSGVGFTEVEGKTDWVLAVSKPHNIEIPRSLVEVVTNWNLPMHYWLKTYVFKAARPYGTFVAVLSTYAASSLLHGLNFQLAAVLFSLGFYSYVEFVFREKLSRIFSACIQARKCKDDCDHTHKQWNPAVIVTNLIFSVLTVLHLTYLGLMFDNSSMEEEGYTMGHTLAKWRNLGFLSHKIVAACYIFHLLI